MANAHAKPHHDYHLVNPSPWPAVGATSAFVAAVGLILWMHHTVDYAPLVLGAGLIGIAYTMIGWWRDVIHEAEVEGDHSQVVQISHRYGMILFIASEVMFFVAWFWAYFNTALVPDEFRDVARIAYTGGVWPPKGVDTFDPWHFPLLNAHSTDFGHDRDLGASLATGKRPSGIGAGLGADHRLGPVLHLRASVGIRARGVSLFR
jgi:cytochrome c oxidase subunit 3